MAISLLFICYALIFIAIHQKNEIILSLIKTTLLISLLVVVSTESSSYFHHFNRNTLIVFWTSCIALLGSWIYFQKKHLNINQVFFEIKTISKNNKWFLVSISSLSLVLLFQSLLYPPNNWDAMAYHIGRIPHWVAQQTIEYYPTHIYRQIYQPYFSSSFMAQMGLLSQSDIWFNALQLIYYLAIVPCLVAIGSRFGFSRLAHYGAIGFWLTNPESILEAVSTQNDIIVTFFLLSVLVFALQSIENQSINPFIWMGMSTGLACLSKGTAYIFLLPLFGIMGFVWLKQMIQARSMRLIIPLLIMASLFVSINAGYFYRNYELTKDLLGKSTDPFFNEKLNIQVIVLQLVKNASVHLGIHPISTWTNQGMVKLHQVLGERIDEPANNWEQIAFRLRKWVHDEDTASNFFQIFWIIGTIGWFLWCVPIRSRAFWLLLFPILTYFLFSIVLKWQPWITRLQIPMFAFFALPVGFCLSKWSAENALRKRLYLIAALITVSYAGLVIIFNTCKPFITNRFTNNVHWNATRFQKYFGSRPSLSEDYRQVRTFIKQQDPSTIGLIIDNSSWEYPFYYDIFKADKPYALPHLNVNNASAKAQNQAAPERIRYIIAVSQAPQITYKDHHFLKIKQFEAFSIYQKGL
ncbi:MAG: hypothetical protein RL329_3547 [Bacteroidota bacterium]